MTFQEKILAHFHLSPEQYQTMTNKRKPEDFLLLSLFPNLAGIQKHITEAISKNEKFLVYGDYDADGMLSTAIMVKTLKQLGANVSSYIPSRYMDGYGIQKDKVERIAEKKFDWIITVDNGIHAHEAIAKAVELGVKVVITDHHQLPEILPNTPLILHPHLNTSNDLPMCGAMMALFLSYALLSKWDDYLLSLAGLATLADYMPLRGINRELVQYALDTINHLHFPIITRLIGHDPIDESVLSMKWIPMINSIGRIVENQNVNRVTVFLTTEDEEERFMLADWIKVQYQQRKEISKKATESLQYNPSDPVIIIKTQEKEGIIGLLATRLGQETQKPVFILSDSNGRTEGYVGSSRALESHSVLLALQSVESTLIRFGGHHGAAGFEVKKDQFDHFKESLIAYYSQLKTHQTPVVEAIPLQEHELTLENFQFLEKLKPFGRDFPPPLFRLKNIETLPLKFIKEGTILSHSWKGFKLFSFQITREDIQAFDRVDFIGEFRTNFYLGKQENQFLALDFIPISTTISS